MPPSTAPPAASASAPHGLLLAVAAALLLAAAPAARAASVTATQTPSSPPSASRAPTPSSLSVPGVIRTLAGDGASGFGGDGGPGTSARLSSPYGLALYASGDLLIADTGNNRIRLLSSSSGIITTVAGNGVQGFSGDGGPATSASLYAPQGVIGSISVHC